MSLKMFTFNWLQRIVARLSGPRVRDDFEAPTIREHLEFGTIAELAEPPFTESALPPDPDQREIARYVLRSTSIRRPANARTMSPETPIGGDISGRGWAGRQWRDYRPISLK